MEHLAVGRASSAVLDQRAMSLSITNPVGLRISMIASAPADRQLIQTLVG
jgi:hypothetical protein